MGTMERMSEALGNLSHSSSEGHAYFSLPSFIENIYYTMKKANVDFATNCNIVLLGKLDKSIDVARLAEALHETLEAHATFSAALVEKDGRPYLVRAHYGRQPIPIVETTDEEMESNVKQFRAIPHQEGEPLYKLVIYTSESKNYLLVRFSHALTDAASLKVLFKEAFSHYDGRKIGTEEIDLFDWSAFYDDFQQSDTAKELVEEFGQLLKGFSPVTPHSENAEPSSTHGTFLNSGEYAELFQFSKKVAVKTSYIILAAYSLALMRMDGRTDIVHQVTFHNRSAIRLVALQACLAWRLPIAAKLPESDLIADYLTQYAEYFQLASKKYFLVEQRIAEEYSDYVDSAVFNDLGQGLGNMKAGKTPVVVDTPKPRMARYPLYVYMIETKNGEVEFTIISTRYNEEQLKALFDDMRHIVKCMMTKEKISEI